MKAIFDGGPRNYYPKEMAEPKPEPHEVKLKPSYYGICFSDCHRYHGHLSDPNNPQRPFGGITGHEFAGTVAEVGSKVEALKAGDRVTVDPRTWCGYCPLCRAGLAFRCQNYRGWIGLGARRPDDSPYNGGAAEYTTVPAETCYLVPDIVTDLQAASIEAAACGTRTIRNCGVSIGDNAVFLGADDYSVSAMQWARHAAAGGKFLVADPSPVRREMVKALGVADEILDPTAADPVKRARELMPFGADYVFIGVEVYVAPSAKYLQQAFDICRVQGNVVWNRNYGNEAYKNATPMANWTSEITLRGHGLYYGEEPWRGGRPRSDYQVTIDAIAKSILNPPKSWKPTVIPFDDLRTKKDVDDAFLSLPDKNAKIFVKIWGS